MDVELLCHRAIKLYCFPFPDRQHASPHGLYVWITLWFRCSLPMHPTYPLPSLLLQLYLQLFTCLSKSPLDPMFSGFFFILNAPDNVFVIVTWPNQRKFYRVLTEWKAADLLFGKWFFQCELHLLGPAGKDSLPSTRDLALWTWRRGKRNGK